MIVRERQEEHQKELERCIIELERKRAQSAKLSQKFKVRVQEVPVQPGMFSVHTRHMWRVLFQTCVKVPQVDINLEDRQEPEGGDVIRGEFTISQKPSMAMKGGEALITFEEESGNISSIHD